MKDPKSWSNVAIVLSLIAAGFAAAVSVTQVTIWLAGTQWILISIALAVYAVYLNTCPCGGCCGVGDKK